MSLKLNSWLALLLGVLIGWVIEWLLEVWYFRRRRLASENRLIQVEADLQERERELHDAKARAESLQAELAAAQASPATPETRAVEARLPSVEIETLAGETEAVQPTVEIETAPAEVIAESQPAAPGEVEPVAVEAAQPPIEVAAEPAPAETATDTRSDLAGTDDLVKIKGIGPKYAAQLREAGITSFVALAAADPQRISEIIQAPEWRQVDYSAWIAEAAALANAPSQAATGDDLTQINGIGPAYAARLRSAGITTLAQLAEADEAHLAEIIDAPTWRRTNYGAWIAQAKVLLGKEE